MPVRRIRDLTPLVLVVLVMACGGGGGGEGDEVVESTTVEPDATTTVETNLSSTAPPDSSTTASSTSIDGEPTLTDNSSLSTVGLDTVTFGMTVTQAEEAAGSVMVAAAPANEDCYWVTPESGPDGVRFMVTSGTIERADVTSGPVTTRSGIGIGTPASRVTELFGDSLETSADGSQLTFVPTDESDAQFRVVFDTDGTNVTALRSGRLPQVTWPDCPIGEP